MVGGRWSDVEVEMCFKYNAVERGSWSFLFLNFDAVCRAQQNRVLIRHEFATMCTLHLLVMTG